MKICTMQELLDAKVLCCEENLGKHVYSACGCDLMSDVLAYVKDQAVLLTGLINSQVVRTAMMMDMQCVVFARGKQPTPDILQLAENCKLTVLSTRESMYTACGKLYDAGLRGGDLIE